MNELTSIGVILLLALLAGHVVKFLHIPEVTGYIIAGIIIGPSVLRLVTGDTLQAIGIFSDVALGLILFSIGSIFEFNKFRQIGPNVIKVAVADAALVFGLMFITVRLMGVGWQASALLAILSVETAAASTLMVMRECNAEGPLTDTLTGVIAINNVITLTAFTVLVSALVLVNSSGSGLVYRSIYTIVWQLIGSVALGYLVGLLLASWAPKASEHGEMLILLTGCILFAVGLALLLKLSTLVTTLAVGATTANMARRSRQLYLVQSQTDPPFYAIFFVIAGANLHLGLLKSLGAIGLAYVAARCVGKLLAAKGVARMTTLPTDVRRNLGYSMLSHAGLAVGLVLALQRRLPELAPEISTVVLAAVLIYELFGPFFAKMAITRVGEAHGERAEMIEAID
jgi:Kef-type K+ transport system membrane component KefB